MERPIVPENVVFATDDVQFYLLITKI